MPTAIPGPLPNWAATLVKLTNAEPHSFLYDLLSYFKDEPSVDNLEWRHLVLHFDNMASSDTADDATVGFDLVNITGGALDTSWTTGDYTTCEALFDTFCTSMLGVMHNMWQMNSYKWYRRKFNDYGNAKPFQDGGPPQRVTIKAFQSGATNYTPAQVAVSVTEKTPWPHHWGRFYWPGLQSTSITANLQISSTTCTTIATAVQTLYAALGSAEFFPVVPVTQIDKVPNRGLLQVNQIQVDTIPDVIRSRRARTAATKVIKP